MEEQSFEGRFLGFVDESVAWFAAAPASPINALRWRAIGGADRDNSQSSAR
jgi:hypothetical protein